MNPNSQSRDSILPGETEKAPLKDERRVALKGTRLLGGEQEGENLLNHRLEYWGQDSSLGQDPARFPHQGEGQVGIGQAEGMDVWGQQLTKVSPLTTFFTSLMVLLFHLSSHPKLVN